MTIKNGDEFRALAREIIEASGDPEPSVIADKLLGQLSQAEMRVALAVTLTDWIRGYRASLDRAVIRGGVKAKPDRDPLTGRAVGPSKVRRVRDWYARVLETSLFTGERWLPLRDCAEADVRGAVAVRRQVAARNSAEADRWEQLADAMSAHQWATVAKVPPAELSRLIGGAK